MDAIKGMEGKRILIRGLFFRGVIKITWRDHLKGGRGQVRRGAMFSPLRKKVLG